MILLIGVALFSSCKKDNTDDNGGGDNPNPTNTTSIISGIVLDLNNSPIQGATVTIEGSTAAPKTTNEFGAFYFHNAPTGNRVSLRFEKNNFMKVVRSETRPTNGVVIIHATMIPDYSPISTMAIISATSGGDINLYDHNTKVSFAPNSFVDASGNPYTGSVKVSLAYLDPSQDYFARLIPGGDMAATNTANLSGYLYSYGIIKVELKDDAGNPLQLKNETTSNAHIEVGVPASMQGAAPATIPLWYFDEIKGRWIEQGFATLTGEKYIGTVSHFTDWNCDVWSEQQATITGTVTDANGNPVAGVSIRTGQSYANTNALGVYSRTVPSGFDLNVTILNYYGHTQVKPAGVLSSGETKTVNFVVPQMNYLYGRIVNCSNTPVAGTVGASWGYDEASSVVQTSNGNFRIPIVEGNSSITIWAYTGTAYTTTYYYADFINHADTMPDIFLCDMVTGPNEFSINGAGYINQTFSNFNIVKTAVYSEFNEGNQTWKETYINIEGEDGKFNLGLNNKITGIYTNGDCWGYIQQIGSSQLYASFSNLSINVTRFGNVGQLVEGTFSGSGNIQEQGDFTITNGKFSVIRMPDQGHDFIKNRSNQKNKIDKMKNRYKR